jgi:hypothetical protein
MTARRAKTGVWGSRWASHDCHSMLYQISVLRGNSTRAQGFLSTLPGGTIRPDPFESRSKDLRGSYGYLMSSYILFLADRAPEGPEKTVHTKARANAGGLGVSPRKEGSREANGHNESHGIAVRCLCICWPRPSMLT